MIINTINAIRLNYQNTQIDQTNDYKNQQQVIVIIHHYLKHRMFAQFFFQIIKVFIKKTSFISTYQGFTTLDN